MRLSWLEDRPASRTRVAEPKGKQGARKKRRERTILEQNDVWAMKESWMVAEKASHAGISHALRRWERPKMTFHNLWSLTTYVKAQLGTFRKLGLKSILLQTMSQKRRRWRLIGIQLSSCLWGSGCTYYDLEQLETVEHAHLMFQIAASCSHFLGV